MESLLEAAQLPDIETARAWVERLLRHGRTDLHRHRAPRTQGDLGAEEEAGRGEYKARLAQHRLNYAEDRFADTRLLAKQMEGGGQKVEALDAAREKYGALQAATAFLLEHKLDKTGWGSHPRGSPESALAASRAAQAPRWQGRHREARK